MTNFGSLLGAYCRSLRHMAADALCILLAGAVWGLIAFALIDGWVE
jgi:hypothetical protein